ncbi:MAG: DUF4129 domain-containing protein [Anaerolineales bacterium]|nr:MAG: DUF4129 domain-containing protein [Anaerolineales bacterium]
MTERWRIREGWGVLFLSLGIAMITGFAVAGAGWTGGLDLIPIVCLGAFIIGLMVAKSLLPGWLAHLFSMVIGFGFSFRLVATLFPPPYTWEFSWAWLWWYIYEWIVALFSGGTSHNNLIFVLQMAFIVWGITYLSMWFIFRTHRVWLAIVPSGALLLVNLTYAPNDITFYLLIYLALTLLLVIRFNFFTQSQIWRREGVHFNAEEVGFDFLRAGAAFALVILTFAWITPGVVAAQSTEIFETLRAPWHDLQAEWNRLFASLNYRPTAGVDFYGKSLELGGPRQLAKVPLLEVEAPATARYWRAVVFDKFTGRGWENSDDYFVRFGADNDALPMITYQGRLMITQTVTLLGPSMSILPMAAQPVWVDRPSRASLKYVSVPSDQATGRLDETQSSLRVGTISYARSRVPLDAGDSYIATSVLSRVPERLLRRAGANYPAWIIERYLELPDSVPERVEQLAQEIAAPHDNAYDRATAIEQFLRSEITYNEKIDAPPPDRDPVDYILFDLKEGYCDYYATSMVVMLRSVGIPSRVVSGYAQGQYDPDRQAYVVLLQDAHTWVEAFFPRFGWIEFEPTAAQPVIVRPPDLQGTTSSGPDQNAESPADSDPRDRMDDLEDIELPPETGDGAPSLWSRLGPAKPGSWILGSLVLLILAAITVWTMQNRRLARLSNVGAIYHNMLRLASWAGALTRPSYTPHEHASALGRVVPEGERPAQRIAGLYTRERYGHKPAGEEEQTIAIQAWQDLRPKLVRQTILRHFTRRDDE